MGHYDSCRPEGNGIDAYEEYVEKRKKNIDILHKPKPKPRKKYKFDRLRFLPKTSSINLNYYDINTLVINAKEGILTINKKNNKEK